MLKEKNERRFTPFLLYFLEKKKTKRILFLPLYTLLLLYTLKIKKVKKTTTKNIYFLKNSLFSISATNIQSLIFLHLKKVPLFFFLLSSPFYFPFFYFIVKKKKMKVYLFCFHQNKPDLKLSHL